jgi:serine/threonine protein kinase
LKLENILLDESNNVKLIDFGFSTCMPADKRSCTFCGTPSYMAPEIVSRREYAGPPVDVWALGVLLYAMLCGCFPFKGSNDSDLYRKIQRGVFSVPEHVEDGPKRLIRKMIQTDPNKRPTAADLLTEDWVETGVSQAPQPDPDSQNSSENMTRQGRTSSTTALFIRPLTATRKPAIPLNPSKALLRRNTSHGR